MPRSLRLLAGLVTTTSAALLVASGCGSTADGAAGGANDDAGTPASGEIDAGKKPADDDSGAVAQDAGPSCEAPEKDCGGVCIDTSADPENCGGCGVKCTAAQECTSGACVDVCPAPAPDPSFTTTPATLYAGAAVTFQPAAVAGVTYAWTFTGGSPATSTEQEPEVTWAAPGTYSVKLEITQGKCVQTKTADVTVVACGGTAEFDYTGTVQDFVVPCGTSIAVDAYGAEGGNGKLGNGTDAAGGLGGRAQATVPVTAGETLHVYVGGMGQSLGTGASPCAGTGGWNGGGDVYDFVTPPNQSEGISGTGGGASDVRRGGDLDGRLVVAGGGGGGGYYGAGGAGGGLGGANGSSSSASRPAPTGGTQAAGGAPGWVQLPNYDNQPGAFGIGGRAYRDGAGSGGGGGGWYGGGAGGFCGGGGGSSWVAAAGNTDGTTTSGVRSGNGRVVITW